MLLLLLSCCRCGLVRGARATGLSVWTGCILIYDLRLSNKNRTYAEDYHIKQYKYLSCLNIKPVQRYRSGSVQDFDRAVWTGPDRLEKINDGPVRFMKLPDAASLGLVDAATPLSWCTSSFDTFADPN